MKENKKKEKKRCDKCIPPVVIGIGGATRSGKSTLSSSLHSFFNCPSLSVCQDKFFQVIIKILK